jgi:hypothetical protein
LGFSHTKSFRHPIFASEDHALLRAVAYPHGSPTSTWIPPLALVILNHEGTQDTKVGLIDPYAYRTRTRINFNARWYHAGILLWRTLRLRSFSYRPESISEDRLFGEHLRDPFDQREQPRCRHGGDKIIEPASLTEQRMGAPFGGV